MRADRNSWAPISGLVLPSHGQPGDVRLLRGELAGGLGGPPARRLAGGQQLAPGPFGERGHARSRPAARGRPAAARGRPRGGSRGAATRRNSRWARASSGRSLVRPSRSIASRYRPSAVSGSLSSARQRASMPEAEVGTAGLGEFREPRRAPRRRACVLPAAGGGLDQLGQRPHGDVERGGVLAGRRGRRQRLAVPAEAVGQDGGRPVRVGDRDALPPGRRPRRWWPRSAATASACVPRRAASIIAVNGAARLPVASQTASASATSAAAVAKSPLHATAVPSAPSRIGSWSSAPASRASRTCRTSIARQASSSHSALAAPCASQPQRSSSATEMSAPAEGADALAATSGPRRPARR